MGKLALIAGFFFREWARSILSSVQQLSSFLVSCKYQSAFFIARFLNITVDHSK